ncbi:MAG: hypothetical protein ACI9M3_001669 [Bacteroidia bacterium]|jgi:hypothetical protein
MNKIIILLLVAFTYQASAQNLENFSKLKAEGPIPDFFVKFLDEKISDDDEKLKNDKSISKKNAADFSAITNYKLQQLIHGGKVLYGDPLTNYANGVLDKLTAASDENLDYVQLYTLKSNEVNAFATHQGVIFITVGLIGQLENEAQLAFILAHELTHVIEKHNQLSYEHTQNLVKNARYGDESISDYYKYSKDNEEDADRAGFNLAIKAGYNAEALNKTFTILLYSYLPIDEQTVDLSFLENEHFNIGENLKIAEESINNISAEEDIDDEFNTHPNISTRRKNVYNIFTANKNEEGSKVYLYGTEKEFLDLRTLARYEMMNIFIQRADYVKGLYHSFILRKVYPENAFLINSQSMMWYGLSAFQNRSASKSYSLSYNKQEGEIQHLYYFLKKLSKDELSTLATQQIWQNSIAHPENEFLTTLRTVVLLDFVSFLDNELSSFGSEAPKPIDAQANETSDEELSKYDKIAKKRDNDNKQNDFHYSLLNVINNKDFILAVDEAKAKLDDKEKLQDELKEQSRKPKKSTLDIPSLIMTTPNFYTQDNRKSAKSNLKKNDLTEGKLVNLVKENAEKLDIKLSFIDNFRDQNFTTENYNEFSQLYDYLSERLQFEGLDFLPYNAQYIGPITKTYNSHYIGLVGIYTEIEKRPFNAGYALVSALTLYPFPLYLKWQLSADKSTNYGFFIMNLETHNPAFSSTKYFNADMNIHLQNAHIYNSLNQIKQ